MHSYLSDCVSSSLLFDWYDTPIKSFCYVCNLTFSKQNFYRYMKRKKCETRREKKMWIWYSKLDSILQTMKCAFNSLLSMLCVLHRKFGMTNINFWMISAFFFVQIFFSFFSKTDFLFFFKTKLLLKLPKICFDSLVIE